MSNNEVIKAKFNQFVEIPVDMVLDSAKNLNVEHFTVTSDAMFKRCFVQGSTNVDEHRRVLVRCVSDMVVNFSEQKLTDRSVTQLSQGKSLSSCSVKSSELLAEVVHNTQASVNLNGELGKQSTGSKKSLPKEPKVDLAVRNTMEDGKACIIGIEMQVRKNSMLPMFIRLQHYGSVLAVKYMDKDGVEKIFEVALCMWDRPRSNNSNNVNGSNDEKLEPTDWIQLTGVNKEILQNEDTIRENSHLSYPLCCVPCMLGNNINVLDRLVTTLNEGVISIVSNVEVPNRRAVDKLHENRKYKQEILKKRFNKLYGCNIDDLRASFQEKFKGKVKSEKYSIKGNTIGGLKEEKDWDKNLKKDFEILEDYEMLEFFSVGNVTSEKNVNDEVISNTIRSLYMETTIRDSAIINDPDQAASVWLSGNFAVQYNKLRGENNRLESELVQQKVVNNIIRQCFKKGTLNRSEIEQIIKQNTLKDVKLSDRDVIIDEVCQQESDIQKVDGGLKYNNNRAA